MKGKLIHRLKCGCCNLRNYKKIKLYNDKLSHLVAANEYMTTEYDDMSPVYPEVVDFLKQKHPDSLIEIHHYYSIGDDVVFINKKYSGYIEQHIDDMLLQA